jgi:hypothetical protein
LLSNLAALVRKVTLNCGGRAAGAAGRWAKLRGVGIGHFTCSARLSKAPRHSSMSADNVVPISAL